MFFFNFFYRNAGNARLESLVLPDLLVYKEVEGVGDNCSKGLQDSKISKYICMVAK
jgi:hypothetical protein